MSVDFLDAFSQLPKHIQSKTSAFIQKFKQTPARSGLNYESIQNAADPNFRSLRVDQNYRAIVRKPDSGDAYLLLWVDKHDEAYAWAQRRICKVNTESGALQIVDLEAASALATELGAHKSAQVKGRFDDVRDRHLARLGVPEEMFGAVRAVVTDEDVDKLLPGLPEEAADSLLMLASGYSVEDILNLQDPREERTIDPKDIDRALETADSQRRFHVVTDDDELLEMLAAPLEKWRFFLHPSQKRLVHRDWNGPARVLGGAGTGKTVVAMHRAKWLAEKRFTGVNDRIFFTTFTRNLAVDIEANLRKICSPETMRRIKVENLDSWVASFLRAEGAPIRMVYDEELDELWQQAFTVGLEYPETFYKDEWKQVIQPQNIQSLQDYFKASRVGRGTRLNRMQRDAVWPVFEEFRALMRQKGLKDSEDAMYDVCSLLKNRGEAERPYCSIIVDEAQDLGPADFALIRALAPDSDRGNNLFIVGDPHQRIYGRQVTLSHCGIEVRGRSRKLRINYRTTEETRKWAASLLSGLKMDDLDGGSDNLTDYRSLMHGNEPWIQGFNSFQAEAEFIHRQLRQLEQAGVSLSSICIVVRNNALVKSYASQLNSLGIETRNISLTQADNPALPGARVATMHRVKGLQFEYVFLAGLTQDAVPPQNAMAAAADKAARNAILKAERCLLHVSATRAKKGIFVTYHGQPSDLLNEQQLNKYIKTR